METRKKKTKYESGRNKKTSRTRILLYLQTEQAFFILIACVRFLFGPVQGCSDTTRVSQCRSNEFECDDRSHCVIQSWVCDGSVDCADGSDEAHHRCHNTTCRSDQFRCRDNTCIPGFLHCSGTSDCADGSDEENCSKSFMRFFQSHFITQLVRVLRNTTGCKIRPNTFFDRRQSFLPVRKINHLNANVKYS